MTAKRKPISAPTNEVPPLLDDEGEVRELTADDFRRFRPSREFPELAEAFERARGQRGPQKAPTKERVGLRLDREVIEHFRATGRGWQSRINDILVEHLKRGGN